jgi:hypothetical protein
MGAVRTSAPWSEVVGDRQEALILSFPIRQQICFKTPSPIILICTLVIKQWGECRLLCKGTRQALWRTNSEAGEEKFRLRLTEAEIPLSD